MAHARTNSLILAPIKLDIDLADFKCPLTKKTFLDPVMAYPCGDHFEREAINKYRETSENCPCCNKPITNLINPSRFFKKLFYKALALVSDLHNSRPFDLMFYVRNLQNRNIPYAEFKENLHSLLRYKEQFNLALKTSAYEDDVPLLFNLVIQQMTFMYDGRTDTIFDNEKFISSLSAEVINFVCQDKKRMHFHGLSMLAMVFIHIPNPLYITKHANILNKINAQGLNAFGTSFYVGYSGMSAVYGLTNRVDGIEFLANNPQIRKMISASTLNRVAGIDKKSAADNLLNCPEGQKLLALDPELAEKIPFEAKAKNMQANVKRALTILEKIRHTNNTLDVGSMQTLSSIITGISECAAQDFDPIEKFNFSLQLLLEAPEAFKSTKSVSPVRNSGLFSFSVTIDPLVKADLKRAGEILLTTRNAHFVQVDTRIGCKL